MKNLKLFFAIMLISVGLTSVLTSCSDKEKDEPNVPASSVAYKVAGTYTGDMDCTVMNTDFEFEDLEVTVVSTDESTVEINIPSCGPAEMHMQMPALKIPGVKVSVDNGVYTLATTEFSKKTEDGKLYTGKIHGSYEKNELTVSYELNYGTMPLPLMFSYTGVKK
ncbi:MAG: calycin-like domain-containing protein [Muribaculaceae bacterium]|nr:calycin-like domain-containing protein [Muribaculaceae bacterium]